MTLPTQMSPQHRITQVFSARAAREGGVVRRKIRDIERYVGIDTFLEELDRRGFTAVENAGQLVIFCDRERVRIASRTIFWKNRSEAFEGFGHFQATRCEEKPFLSKKTDRTF